MTAGQCWPADLASASLTRRRVDVDRLEGAWPILQHDRYCRILTVSASPKCSTDQRRTNRRPDGRVRTTHSDPLARCISDHAENTPLNPDKVHTPPPLRVRTHTHTNNGTTSEKNIPRGGAIAGVGAKALRIFAGYSALGLGPKRVSQTYGYTSAQTSGSRCHTGVRALVIVACA